MDPVDFIRLKLTRLFRGKVDRKISIPLGIYAREGRIVMLLQNRVTPGAIDVAVGQDLFSFGVEPSSYTLTGEYRNAFLGSASAFMHDGKRHLLFKNRKGLFVASVEGSTIMLKPVSMLRDKAVIADNVKVNGKLLMYCGERAIHTAYSDDLVHWIRSAKPVLIDAHPLEVGSVFDTGTGILLLYFKKEIEHGILYHNAYFALFDRNNPDNLLWKTEQPVWKQKEEWKGVHAFHLGAVLDKDRIVSYWQVENQGIYGVLISGFKYDPRQIAPRLKLDKHETNPIIAPKAGNDWEAFNTFNPAAVYAGEKVHILYRAQGFDYVSTVGYAASADGIRINERSARPIFTPHLGFETNPKKEARHDFMSGGGMGGCEDPRITLMDGRVYMTYVAFDGWSPPRLALTSILLDDFLAKRWNWSKPVLISPPGIVDKSGCLLPEKINGKYVFFHRVFPDILIDFIDDLNFDGRTKWLKGQYRIKIRQNMWDSRKIGAGAPPLKTKDGWLLIYYGVDDRDASKYHIGAMLLDLKDPTKVLHRSNEPILRPDSEFENNGFKPGIAYPCGAVIVKDQLLVYYGGADSVVCVATANLDDFLAELTSKETATLTPVQVREVDY